MVQTNEQHKVIRFDPADTLDLGDRVTVLGNVASDNLNLALERLRGTRRGSLSLLWEVPVTDAATMEKLRVPVVELLRSETRLPDRIKARLKFRTKASKNLHS